MAEAKDFRNADPDPSFPRVDESELPQLEDGQFPPNAITSNERYRFRLCVAKAIETFPEEIEQQWYMARSLYNNPEIPT